jgi:hypothetical protein
MKIKQFIRRIFDFGKQKFSPSAMPSPDSERVKKLMEMLDGTREVELTCDEVLAVLDQIAELAVQGENVAHLMQLVQHHLEMCSDCREEYNVLVSILQGAA